MKLLPTDVAHYKSTALFDQDTVPAALLRNHTTAARVWARIRILEGTLRYRIDDATAEDLLLSPERPGIVEPQVPHHVEVIGPVRFCIDFHR
jgi:tellurite resistance-related uncharacterized protein